MLFLFRNDCLLPPPPRKPDDSLGREQDGEYIDGAENHDPVVDVTTQVVSEPHDRPRSYGRPDERSDAAEDDHEHRVEGRRDRQHLRGHELRHECVCDPRQCRERTADDECDVLVEPDVVPSRLHPRLALSDSLQTEPEG